MPERHASRQTGPRTKPGIRYVAASLSLGLIAVWGSENLFWTVPQAPVRPLELLVTWAAYSLVLAAALSAVLWAGLGGWRAAFMGGAILGFGVEGVIVGTMYESFPLQLIWTPLAWHALLTGLVVFAFARRLAQGPVAVQIAGLVVLGVLGATWGLYWPIEIDAMPGHEVTLPYLVGLALPVVAAHVLLDRLGPLHPPGPLLLWAAPVVMALLWLLRASLSGAFIVLSCPAMIFVTVWAMRRLGRAGQPLDFGSAVPLWRHALFLLFPLTVALLVVPGWQALGAVAVNIPVAWSTGVIGAGLWLWLVDRAARTAR
ncbi:hypothetical protein E7811_01925 [Aliigemmobacter aestuarii]|uniref:Uncharacterized protein n=1 Tax=Aliigemmobacter aestuarii TaxID=1445661 RepID=A0A4S3MPV2_9RHOB|nr:hypothetical protein [Gemmobacter aestuarii]THD84526.1 hypothetical protein E7811_01925 [Gemmobacter aestuarii]